MAAEKKLHTEKELSRHLQLRLPQVMTSIKSGHKKCETVERRIMIVTRNPMGS